MEITYHAAILGLSVQDAKPYLVMSWFAQYDRMDRNLFMAAVHARLNTHINSNEWQVDIEELSTVLQYTTHNIYMDHPFTEQSGYEQSDIQFFSHIASTTCRYINRCR